MFEIHFFIEWDASAHGLSIRTLCWSPPWAIFKLRWTDPALFRDIILDELKNRESSRPADFPNVRRYPPLVEKKLLNE